MAKVLTIRDPRSGTLIAEEWIQQSEDRDSALARIYQKTLGPEAPEQTVISKSIWMDDSLWKAELSRDWGGFELAIIGPKSSADLESSRLVLAMVSEPTQTSKMEFPIDKSQLDAIKRGRRHHAVVPVGPEHPLAVGDRVTFVEAGSDPFGTPMLVPNGETVSVDLTEVRNQDHKWAGLDVYHIAWNRARTKKRKARNATSEAS